MRSCWQHSGSTPSIITRISKRVAIRGWSMIRCCPLTNAHQQTRGDKGLEYDPLLPLDKRKLLPEYSYYSRREKRKRTGSDINPVSEL